MDKCVARCWDTSGYAGAELWVNSCMPSASIVALNISSTVSPMIMVGPNDRPGYSAIARPLYTITSPNVCGFMSLLVSIIWYRDPRRPITSARLLVSDFHNRLYFGESVLARPGRISSLGGWPSSATSNQYSSNLPPYCFRHHCHSMRSFLTRRRGRPAQVDANPACHGNTGLYMAPYRNTPSHRSDAPVTCVHASAACMFATTLRITQSSIMIISGIPCTNIFVTASSTCDAPIARV